MTTTTRIYKFGGTLNPKLHYYIRRQADDVLLDLCRRGEYAYIFNARQTGKSSLIERTRSELVEQWSVRAITISLESVGSAKNSETWFSTLLDLIAKRLKLKLDVMPWWNARAQYTPVRRWEMFFEEVALTEIPEPVVVFIDEIDKTINLDFRDDFFGVLRLMYNERANTPELNRVSFVLAGMATPQELIGDSGRTSYNIGKAVELGDLTEKEGAVNELAEGLGLATAEARKDALRCILSWTGGHPYLTQKLCACVQEQEWPDCRSQNVDQLVFEEFLSGENGDNNLEEVERGLTVQREAVIPRIMVLEEYERVLNSKVRDKKSPVQAELKLTGVVKVEDSELRLRNRIYQKFFDRQWLRRHYRPTLRESLWRWWATRRPVARQVVAAILILLVVALMLTTAWAVYQQRLARQSSLLARARELAAVSQTVSFSPERKLLLAIEALAVTQREGEPTAVQAEQALRDALAIPESNTLVVGSDIIVLALSPGGRWLATGSVDDTVRIWDMQNLAAEPVVLRGHDAAIYSIAFSPDGRWLATGNADNTVGVWDMQNLASERVVLRGHESIISTLAFSPDGRWLATGSWDFTVGVWDIQNLAAEPVVLRGHESIISTLAFSPDGRWLATGSGDGTVQVWDTQNLAAEPVLRHGEDIINAIAFSPDGRWLATGSVDSTVQIWETQNLAAEPVVLHWHESGVTEVYFSLLEGQLRLTTASRDGTVMTWNMDDLSSGPVELRKSEGSLMSENDENPIMFTLTLYNRFLIARSMGDRLQILELNLDRLEELACQAAGRNFTQNEWAQYFPDEPYRKTCEQWPAGQ